jgi:hypothetical protein
MTTERKTPPKPRKWNRLEDGRCCLACTKEFKRGDDVFPLAACCIHAGCVRLYVEQCKELGIDP